MPSPPVVAGIGELLWDILPHAEELGGAPINFCYHAAMLGAEAWAISTVGEDRRGGSAVKALQAKGVHTGSISTASGYPTGYVEALIDVDGVATYRFPDEVAWDHLSINRQAQSLSHRVHAVCFGSLAQRSSTSQTVIIDYISHLPTETIRVFDLNLRQQFYNKEIIEASLACCTVLKLNDDELAVLSTLLGLAGTTDEQLKSLLTAHNLDLVILTKGADGAILLSGQQRVEHAGQNVTVVDTIGAGDSFTAAVTIGLLHNRPLAEIIATASNLSAYVCGQVGAMPHYPDTPGFPAYSASMPGFGNNPS